MKKVLVGMSGGVDSSVSALLLKNMGYDVIGGTMKLLDNDETNNAIKEAKKICNMLEIKHYVFDFTNEFKNIVISNFIDSYKNCETPNPCVLCNRYFKFGLFYEKAKELECDYISTGHYAKIIDGKLYESNISNKDQSYFLWYIKKDVLNHILLPLNNFSSKEEIRKIAKDNNLPIHDKKDSQDICFINGDYKKYIQSKIKNIKSGNIILKSGEIIGKHDGLTNYTIGQRKGLNTTLNRPLYVIDFDILNNQLIVGDENELYSDSLTVKNLNLLVDNLPNNVYAKIRSRVDKKEATISYIEDKIIVKFKEKQRAITNGQSIVFYKDGICLGGGIIEKI